MTPDYLTHAFNLDDPSVASSLDETAIWGSRFGELIFEHLDLQRDTVGLDIASGLGFPVLELAQRHGPTCRFVAVDLWRAGLQRAAHKRDVYGLPNVYLMQADAGFLPLPSRHFNLVTMNLGVNNFADPHAVLTECARVAKPQARLALTSNLVGHMREFYVVFRQTLTDLWDDKYLARLDANEGHRGTPESLTALVEGAGFTLTKVIEDQFTMRFLDGSALFRHFLVRIGFLAGWRAVVDPADEARLFATLEARLNEQAARDGHLTMTIPMLYLEARRDD